jgi:hypothetical protein
MSVENDWKEKRHENEAQTSQKLKKLQEIQQVETNKKEV